MLRKSERVPSVAVGQLPSAVPFLQRRSRQSCRKHDKTLESSETKGSTHWSAMPRARCNSPGCFTMAGDRSTSKFAVECLPIIERPSRSLASCSLKQRHAKVKVFVCKGVFFFRLRNIQQRPMNVNSMNLYKQHKEQGK